MILLCILNGEYNGIKFEPTQQNVLHYLDLYNSDKEVGNKFSGKEYAKLAGIIGAGALAAYGGAYALSTLPLWRPTAGRLFSKYVAAPTAAGETFDLVTRPLLGGLTTSELASNYLQRRGWNLTLADVTGSFTNPGYWINFGGTGRYTAPLFNKIGLGLEKEFLTPEMELFVKSNLSKGKFQTKVVDPTLKYLDKNLYKLLRLNNPILFRFKPINLSDKDLPHFKFTTEDNPKSDYFEFPLFHSNAVNEKIYGDALHFKNPEFNLNFIREPLIQDLTPYTSLIIYPTLAGLSATDIALNDDRNPYIRGLEYTLLGKYGLNKLIHSRINNAMLKGVGAKEFYLSYKPNSIVDCLADGRNKLLFKWRNNTGRYKNNRPVYFTKHPGIDVTKASFDDLEKFIIAEHGRGENLNCKIKDGFVYYNGDIIALRGKNNSIDRVNGIQLSKLLGGDYDIIDYNTGKHITGTMKLNDEGGFDMPEEYTNTLKNNIEYVRNVLLPGTKLKVYGSAGTVIDAKFPHPTHDIDFYITANEFNNLVKNGKLPKYKQISPDTYRFRFNEDFGELADIDLNVLGQDENGFAVGERAEELFKQYFPEEYEELFLKMKSARLNGDEDAKLQITKTPDELLEIVDPSTKSIMDSFDVDFLGSRKSKHKFRSWSYLVYSDPEKVANGINLYAKSLVGSNVELFPMAAELLTDKEINLLALKKLGVNLSDSELERIASDPYRMKNVLDALYLTENTAMRYIRGTWPGSNEITPENFRKSATTWIANPDNGGNAKGAGLNVAIGGDSEWVGSAKAFILPKTKYKSNNLLDLIDEIRNNFGGNELASLILEDISSNPDYKEQQLGLKKIYDTLGWNFLQNGSPLGLGRYASATRDFDFNNDYIGIRPKYLIMHPLISRLKTNSSHISFLQQPRTIRHEDFAKGYRSDFAERLHNAFKDYYPDVSNTEFGDKTIDVYYFDNSHGNNIGNTSFFTPIFGIGTLDFAANNYYQNKIQEIIDHPENLPKDMSEDDKSKFNWKYLNSSYPYENMFQKSDMYEDLKDTLDKYNNSESQQ